MNTWPPQRKTNAVAAAGSLQAIPGGTTLQWLTHEQPELRPAVQWMENNGCDPAPAVQAGLAKLLQRGRHLPAAARLAYVQKIVLGQFLTHWVKKHKKTTLQSLDENPDTRQSEVRPFKLAMMAVGTEQAFKKIIPTMARKKVVAGYGGDLGDAYNFTCFVTTNSNSLIHRFLMNFDPARGGPAAAVAYLQTAAVSHYLYKGVLSVPDHEPLARHLKKSTRMDTRTKLAAKLVYLPSLLNKRERRTLQKKYGAAGSFAKRMKVKAVAELLGYPSAATLSRKLYRVKQWVGKPAKTPQIKVKY